MSDGLDINQATHFVKEYLMKNKKANRSEIVNELSEHFGIKNYNKVYTMLTKVKKNIKGVGIHRKKTGEVWFLLNKY